MTELSLLVSTATRILTVPPTSSSTDKVNSLLKNIIGPHRHNISLHLLHASTFIAFNKKAMRAAAAKDSALEGSCDEKATIRNLRNGDRPLGFDWPAPACCAWILRAGAPRSSRRPRTRTKRRCRSWSGPSIRETVS